MILSLLRYIMIHLLLPLCQLATAREVHTEQACDAINNLYRMQVGNEDVGSQNHWSWLDSIANRASLTTCTYQHSKLILCKACTGIHKETDLLPMCVSSCMDDIAQYIICIKSKSRLHKRFEIRIALYGSTYKIPFSNWCQTLWAARLKVKHQQVWWICYAMQCVGYICCNIPLLCQRCTPTRKCCNTNSYACSIPCHCHLPAQSSILGEQRMMSYHLNWHLHSTLNNNPANKH